MSPLLVFLLISLGVVSLAFSLSIVPRVTPAFIAVFLIVFLYRVIKGVLFGQTKQITKKTLREDPLDREFFDRLERTLKGAGSAFRDKPQAERHPASAAHSGRDEYLVRDFQDIRVGANEDRGGAQLSDGIHTADFTATADAILASPDPPQLHTEEPAQFATNRQDECGPVEDDLGTARLTAATGGGEPECAPVRVRLSDYEALMALREEQKTEEPMLRRQPADRATDAGPVVAYYQLPDEQTLRDALAQRRAERVRGNHEDRSS